MDTLASGCTTTTTTSQPLSYDNHQQQQLRLRDASFSSYLNRSEEAYLHKLPDKSSLAPNSIINTTHERHLHLGKKRVEAGEIEVFGAEKYFNEGINQEDSRFSKNGALKYRHSKDELVKIVPMRPRIQPGTPSFHSESSWNSQSALLQSIQRKQPQKKAKKRNGKNLLASLGCNCSCNDNNSVDINNHVGEPKTVTKGPINNDLVANLDRTNKSRLNPLVMEEVQCKKIDEVGIGLNSREDCFTFPILNSNLGKLAAKAHLQEEEDDEHRNSLEVFGSPVLEKKNKSSSLDRKLNMWTRDNNEMENDDGNESETSSDLFEIESFTTTNNGNNPLLLRQGSNGGLSSCVTPTTSHYAPSEASIEWSVVTASAADFSGVSDSEESIRKAKKMSQERKSSGGKGTEKRRAGNRLGCKSHKAVRVAGEAYRTNGKTNRTKL